MRNISCPTCYEEATYVVYSSFSYLYCKACKIEVGGSYTELDHLYVKSWYYNGYDKRCFYMYDDTRTRYRIDEALSIVKLMDKGHSFSEAVKKAVG